MTKKSLQQKALTLVIILAALLFPTKGWAQAYDKETAESHNSGAFYELIAYDTYLDELANALRAVEFNNRGGGIGLGGAESENPTPVGSGIIVLMAAGAGYALLKRKEDKQ